MIVILENLGTGIRAIALTGKTDGKLASLSNALIMVSSNRINEIQEMRIVCGHLLCELVEEGIC